MKQKLFFNTLFSLLILSFLGFYFVLPRVFIDTKNTGFHREKFAEAEYVDLSSYDGLHLEAFILEPKKPKATIILVHGLRACKEFYAEKARELTNKGYRVLAPDLRAHGNSGGTYCTFGVKERHDIASWASYASERFPNEEIGIWGQSLGGAISLQALALEPLLKFGIIESTFSNFTDVGRDYLGRYFGFKINWLNDFIEWRVAEIGGFNPAGASPYEACKNITQPILLVHGEKDKNIDVEYAHENFSVLKSEKKRMILLPEADHNNVWQLGGQRYLEEVVNFIERQIE